MKILVCFLSYVVIVYADPLRSNPSQLENKLLAGNLTENQKTLLFMASLQIYRKHMCGAGMFQLGYLISAGTCVKKIKERRYAADVVMGHNDLDKGERLEILDVEIYRLFFGVIRVEVTEHLKNIGTTTTFPPLIGRPFHLRAHGKVAILCGWGSTAEHEVHSNSLHCIMVQIQSWITCSTLNNEKGVDYKSRYHCAYEGQAKKLTQRDLGSPVTKKYKGHDGDRLYIIGIAVDEFESDGSFYTRFIKSATISKQAEHMVKGFEIAGRVDNGYSMGRLPTNN